MKITDTEAVKILNRVRSSELWNSLDGYPEDERDGRSDMQMIMDELSYILSCAEEEGHAYREDLEWAREVLRKTKNGKVMPYWGESLIPVYKKSDIQNSRDLLNEYRRLVNLKKRLQDKGYIGAW